MEAGNGCEAQPGTVQRNDLSSPPPPAPPRTSHAEFTRHRISGAAALPSFRKSPANSNNACDDLHVTDADGLLQ